MRFLGTWVCSRVGLRLDSMVLKVSSNQNDSVTYSGHPFLPLALHACPSLAQLPLPAHFQGCSPGSGCPEGLLLPAGISAPQGSGQGPPFQRNLFLGSSGGCYLVTTTHLFLCDLDIASSHRLESPNVRFLPRETFWVVPVSPLAVWGPATCSELALGPWCIKPICKLGA